MTAEMGFLVSRPDEDSSYQARIAVVVVVVAAATATATAALVIMGCALEIGVAWRLDEEYRSELVTTIWVALLVLPVMLDSSGEAV